MPLSTDMSTSRYRRSFDRSLGRRGLLATMSRGDELATAEAVSLATPTQSSVGCSPYRRPVKIATAAARRRLATLFGTRVAVHDAGGCCGGRRPPALRLGADLQPFARRKVGYGRAICSSGFPCHP
jgi:hypothetical protein